MAPLSNGSDEDQQTSEPNTPIIIYILRLDVHCLYVHKYLKYAENRTNWGVCESPTRVLSGLVESRTKPVCVRRGGKEKWLARGA